MPAIRRARRSGREHATAPGLSATTSPGLSSTTSPGLSSTTSSGLSATGRSSTTPSSSTFALPGLPAFLSSQGDTRGYSTDTTPLFLRRRRPAVVADSLIESGREASHLLGDISNSLSSNGSGGVPGPWETLQLIAASAGALFDTVASVRTNRVQCRQLVERVHQIVRALINLLGEQGAVGEFRSSGAGGGMRSLLLRAVDQFLETLVTLHEILREQAAHGLLTRILRHLETRDRLAECGEALQQALDVFNVQTTLISHSSLGSLRRQASVQHEEVLSALRRKGYMGGEGDQELPVRCFPPP